MLFTEVLQLCENDCLPFAVECVGMKSLFSRDLVCGFSREKIGSLPQ